MVLPLRSLPSGPRGRGGDRHDHDHERRNTEGVPQEGGTLPLALRADVHGVLRRWGDIGRSVLRWRRTHRLSGPDRPSSRVLDLALAVILTVPMVGWMRFRHHGWRPSLEMGSATMGLGFVLVAFGAVGLVPIGAMFEWVTSLTCPVMLIPMLLRLNLYTGGMDHHAHAA